MATFYEFGGGIKTFVDEHPNIDCGQGTTEEIELAATINGEPTVVKIQKTTTGEFHYYERAANSGNPAVNFFLTPSTR